MKSKYTEIPENIAPDMLADNCYLRKEEEIRHDFTKAELDLLKHDFYDIAARQTERNRIAEIVKELMNASKDVETIEEELRNIHIGHIGSIGLKQLKKDMPAQLLKITSGYEIKVQTVYGFDHQDVERMAFYNEIGQYLYDRPLATNEYQTKLSLSKVS